MLTKYPAIFISAFALSAAAAFSSFAAGSGSGTAFPYEIEFDVEECGRICYAGHPGSTVQYRDGLAVTPETSFRVVSRDGEHPSEDASDLSVTISVVYENDSQSGSRRETVRQYDAGDLAYGEDYRLLSDNSAASLEERDKLYSDSLTGLEMTLSSRTRDVKKKTIYLYVCPDDDFVDYLMNAPEETNLDWDAEEDE